VGQAYFLGGEIRRDDDLFTERESVVCWPRAANADADRDQALTSKGLQDFFESPTIRVPSSDVPALGIAETRNVA
jgi:hypothetical protein